MNLRHTPIAFLGKVDMARWLSIQAGAGIGNHNRIMTSVRFLVDLERLILVDLKF